MIVWSLPRGARADVKAMKEVLVTKWRAFRGRPDFIMPLRGARFKAMAKALIFSSYALADIPPPFPFGHARPPPPRLWHSVDAAATNLMGAWHRNSG